MIFFQGSRNRRGTPASSVTQATVTHTLTPAPAPRSISKQTTASSTTTTSRPDIHTERSSSFMSGQARKSLGKYIDSDNYSVASTTPPTRPRAPTDASVKRPPSAHNTQAQSGGGFLASIWTLGTALATGKKEVVNDLSTVAAGFKRERPVTYVVGDDGVTSGTETDGSGLTDDLSASETGSDESEVELSEEEEIDQRSVSDAKILVTKGKRVDETDNEITPRAERQDPMPEGSSRGESFEIIIKHSEHTEAVSTEVLFDANESEGKKISDEVEGYVEDHFGPRDALDINDSKKPTAVEPETEATKLVDVNVKEPEVRPEEPAEEQAEEPKKDEEISPVSSLTASPVITPEPRVESPGTAEIAIQVTPTVEIAIQTDFDDVPVVPAKSEARNKSPVQGLGVEGADVLEPEPIVAEKPVIVRKSMIEEMEELEAKRIGKRPVRVSSPKSSPMIAETPIEADDNVVTESPIVGPSNSKNIPTSRRLPPLPPTLKVSPDVTPPPLTPTSPTREGAPRRRMSIANAGRRLSWLGGEKDQELKFDADGNPIEPEMKRRLSRRLSISGAVKKVQELKLSSPKEEETAEGLELKFDADGKPIDPGPSTPASPTEKKKRRMSLSFMDAVKAAQEAASLKKEKEHAIDDHDLEISPKQHRNRRMSFMDAVKKATSPKHELENPVDETADLDLKFDADGKPIDPGPSGVYASPTTKMRRRMSIREAVSKVREEISPKHHEDPIVELKFDADGKPIDPGPDPFTTPSRTRRLSIFGQLPKHLDVTANKDAPATPTTDHVLADDKSSLKSKPKLFKAPTFHFGTSKSSTANDKASSIADSEKDKKPALFRRATLGLGVRHSPKPSVDSTDHNGSAISVASSAMPPVTPVKNHERRKSGMFRLGSIARKKTDSSIPTPSTPTTPSADPAASRPSFSSAVRPITSNGQSIDDAVSIAESATSKRSSIKRPFFRRGTMSNGPRPGTSSGRPRTSNGEEQGPGLFRRGTMSEVAVKESAVVEEPENGDAKKEKKGLGRATTFMRTRRGSELPKFERVERKENGV